MNIKKFMVKIFEIIHVKLISTVAKRDAIFMYYNHVCFMHVWKFSYLLVLYYYILTTQIWTYKDVRSRKNLTPIRPPIPLKQQKSPVIPTYTRVQCIYTLHTSIFNYLHPVKISHLYSEQNKQWRLIRWLNIFRSSKCKRECMISYTLKNKLNDENYNPLRGFDPLLLFFMIEIKLFLIHFHHQ